MKFKTLNGKIRNKNINKYRVNWDKPSRSKFQFAVKQFLRQYWEKHVVYEEMNVVGTKLKVDFFNATKGLAIEVDGAQHNEFNKFYHGTASGYLQSLKRDDKKEKFFELNGIKLIRIFPEDLDNLNQSFFQEKFGVSLI
jgi:very-short-patch-repair endonuclease